MNSSGPQSVGVRKKRWVVCFENTILDLDLSIYEKMVFIVLCSHAKKDGPAFPSVRTIAKEASCSRTKVFEALKTLEEQGIITRENRVFPKRGQTSNLYEIADIEPRPHCGQGDDNSPSSSAIRTGASVSRTGSVRGADAPLNVFEQDHLNMLKELKHPPSPQGEDEGAETSEPEKNESKTQGQKTMTQREEREENRSQKPETPTSPDSDVNEAIRSLYNEILPELPGAEKITNSRAKELNRRIREDPERKELSWWRRYFLSVREFPWLMGFNPGNWRAGLDWLIGERGMQKILEGGFVRSPVNGGRTEAGAALQKKYTDKDGIVDVKALLRDLETA
jgi:predicted transcriptional regulator